MRKYKPTQDFITYHAGRGGWSPWVSPKMKGYKMKCCECGLVHEIEFKIVRFIGDPDSKGLTEIEPIKDKDVQVIWRLRRAD